ncbi:PREDICTED: uncharacterized protein LOC109585589 [Amphimedon queenslandica]|uniref:Uncharacterized protein n=1 Tax=Amphimedon queenslandica TaxID=400682 RepID=A0AAN0JJX7_AMPQE|nr:PREDICTED: uncharacterized protein LOC109585589 [Amphimedon queenslandica]|eukprot:XP_019857274.1 PREDICTED: uncharacterized protein LOC109585589 [Amphimedon queenslandica]
MATAIKSSNEKEYLLPAAEGGIQGEKKDTKKKWNKKWILSVLCLFTVIMLVCIACFVPLFTLSYSTSKTSDETLTIQDTSSPLLITVNSSIYEVSVTLLSQNADDAIFEVFSSDTKPIKVGDYLPLSHISKLEGLARYNYNYLGGDLPIYLIEPSSITYSFEVIEKNNMCVATDEEVAILYLFDNNVDYNQFRNYGPYHAVKSYPIDTTNNYLVAVFNITKADLYYVGIEIKDGYIVESYVSVLQYTYNISGYNNPSDCNEYLNINDPTCVIETCNKFYCKKSRNKFIYIRSISESYSTVQLQVLYSTTNVSSFTQFWASIAFIILLILFTILFVIYLIFSFRRKICF